jgi:hypothetical protein
MMVSLEEYMEHIVPWISKEKSKDHNMQLLGLGKDSDLEQLCPKTSLDITSTLTLSATYGWGIYNR